MRRLLPGWIGASLLASLSCADVGAADAARGAALYANTNGAPVSCANASCHGTNVASNKNKISRGANAPSVITSAIAGNTGGMGFLSAYCDATCAADIAAYIANPSAASSPSASVTPAALTFAGTNVGSASAAQTVTVVNAGAGTLTLSSIAISGTAAADFTRGGTCAVGSALGAGASCSVTLTFRPSAAGSRAASLVVGHNATGGSSSVSLTGTGVAVAAPSIAVSATLLDFGSVVVATPAAAKSVIVTNPGNATLSLTGVAIAGTNPTDFVRSGGTCSSSLAAGASCTIDVGFTPGALGTRGATMTISGNASNGSPVVTLTGAGQAAPAPVASLGAASLGWGGVTVGARVTQSVTLSNVGNAPLPIGGITIGGSTAFAIGATDCGTSLAAGASCVIPVVFAPVAAVAYTANLAISDGAAGSPHQVALGGSGVAGPTAQPQWTSAAPLTFAPLTVGQQSVAQTATLTNAGTASLVVAGLSIGGTAAADFLRSGSCAVGAGVAPGASCTVSVVFAPAAAGTRTAQLTLTTDGGASLSRDLIGDGIVLATHVGAVSPAAVDFGLVATAQALRDVVLSNAGTAPLTVSAVTVTGPFTVAAAAATAACPPLPFTLLPGQQCGLGVGFVPTQAGAAAGELSVTTDATVPTLRVALAGTAPAAVDTIGASAPAAPTAAAPTAGGSLPQNAGAGGCTVVDGTTDPLLPALSLAALVLLLRRRGQRAH